MEGALRQGFKKGILVQRVNAGFVADLRNDLLEIFFGANFLNRTRNIKKKGFMTLQSKIACQIGKYIVTLLQKSPWSFCVIDNQRQQ